MLRADRFDEAARAPAALPGQRCELDEVYQPAADRALAGTAAASRSRPERLHEAQRSRKYRGPLRAGQDVAQHELDEEGPRVFVFDGGAACARSARRCARRADRRCCARQSRQ